MVKWPRRFSIFSAVRSYYPQNEHAIGACLYVNFFWLLIRRAAGMQAIVHRIIEKGKTSLERKRPEGKAMVLAYGALIAFAVVYFIGGILLEKKPAR